MIITISGLPGSGKTTASKNLSEQLDMSWYSIGRLRGEMAQDRGMTIDEFNKLGETEGFTDKDVDAYQQALGQREDDFIIDGRLSWHFIPHSFKVFLDADPDAAAARIYEDADARTDEDPYNSVQEVKERIKKRMASDQKRYQKYYGVDFLDRSNYDLIVDTTDKSPEDVTQTIIHAAQEWEAKQG